MSAQLQVVVGADRNWPVQCWLDGGTTPASFGASDTLTAYVYRGGDQAQLFALATAPYADNGGTGYAGGQVQLSVSSTNSATLEADGLYAVQVWWTPSGTSKNYCVWRGTLLCLPSAGSATQPTLTYCAYSDMLRFGPWVEQLQDSASAQEGFYDQRLLAREWFDWAVINNYRGASVGNFDTTSTLAFAFGGGVGWRRGTGPSPSMVTWLAADQLIVRPQVTMACAYKALAIVGLAQVGTHNRLASFGAYCRDMADRLLTGITAEVDLNNDGIGEIFINLSSTNTLFT